MKLLSWRFIQAKSPAAGVGVAVAVGSGVGVVRGAVSVADAQAVSRSAARGMAARWRLRMVGASFLSSVEMSGIITR